MEEETTEQTLLEVTEFLKVIIDLKPTMDRIIECCPYDAQKNLNKLLTEEIFFDKNYGLYYETDEAKELRVRITKEFFFGSWNKRILFLYGYSGIGKSTFLRKLIYENNTEINPEIIDFQDVILKIKSRNKSEDETKKKGLKSDNPIIAGLQQYIYKLSETQQIEHYEFIRDNKTHLKINFDTLYKVIKKQPLTEANEKLDYWQDILFSLNLNDTLYVFFIYILRKAKISGKEKTIVMFDNLDGIDLEYFNEDFRLIFPDIMDQMTQLSQNEELFGSSIDFVSQFKFIFCLRDANNSQINSNNYDRIWNHSIEEKIAFDNETYEGAFFKRLDYIQHIYTSDEIQNLIGISIDQLKLIIKYFVETRIYSNTFLTLFNYDFRKLSISLFESITNLKSDSMLIISGTYPEKYGINSRILLPILNYLCSKNYLQAFYKQKIDWTIPEGYCHPARMILTFMINKSNNRINSPERLSVITEEISLFDLVSFFDGIYTPNTVIETLTNMFKFHKDSWIHPITIKNKIIKNKSSFHKELKMLSQHKEYEEQEKKSIILKEKDENKKNEIRLALESILIRHNPASLSYLRYISADYNYYLSICKIKKSIFDHDLKNLLREDSKLIEAMNAVYTIASNHVSVMRRFLSSKFLSTKYTLEEYKLSRYSWKYKSAYPSPQKRGILHSRRIITSHITYLNNYRKYVIEKSHKSENQLKYHKVIVDKINQYNNLFKGSDDQETLDNLFNNYADRINAIKTSGYKLTSVDIIPKKWIPQNLN